MSSSLQQVRPPAGTHTVVLGDAAPEGVLRAVPARTARGLRGAPPGRPAFHGEDATVAGVVLLTRSVHACPHEALAWALRHTVPGGYLIAERAAAPDVERMLDAGFERLTWTPQIVAYRRASHPLTQGLVAEPSRCIKPIIWPEVRAVVQDFELDPDLLDLNASNRIGVLKRSEMTWRRWLSSRGATVRGLDRFPHFLQVDGSTSFLLRLARAQAAEGRRHMICSAGGYEANDWIRDLCALDQHLLPPSLARSDLRALEALLDRTAGRVFAILDFPQAATGGADPAWLEDLLDLLDHHDVPTYLDLALYGTVDHLEVDARRACVRGVLVGLGKAMGVWHLRASVAFMRERNLHYEEIGKWSCFNTLTAELACRLVSHSDPTEMPRRYRFHQRLYCAANGLDPSDCVLLGLGRGGRAFRHIPKRRDTDVQRVGIGDALLEMLHRDQGSAPPSYLRPDHPYHRSADVYEWSSGVLSPRLNAAFHAVYSSDASTALRMRLWGSPWMIAAGRLRRAVTRRLRGAAKVSPR